MATAKLPEIFLLDWQYNHLLEQLGMTEERMHPEQRIQLKRTFYVACGQMLILFRNDLPDFALKFGATAGVDMLEEMIDQVKNYWQEEAAAYIRKQN